MISDGWTTADLIYKWKEDDPVQVVKDLNLPRFKLERYSTDYCNTKTNTGWNFKLSNPFPLHVKTKKFTEFSWEH